MDGEDGTAERISSVVDAPSSSDERSQPANTNAPRARGTGEVAAAPPRVVQLPDELVALANEIGIAWSHAYVQTLEAQDRDIVGAWPGTIREARRHLLLRIKTKLEPEQLDQLARLANLAARRGWESVSEPDLES